MNFRTNVQRHHPVIFMSAAMGNSRILFILWLCIEAWSGRRGFKPIILTFFSLVDKRSLSTKRNYDYQNLTQKKVEEETCDKVQFNEICFFFSKYYILSQRTTVNPNITTR